MAFANLWEIDSRDEVSIDLMRYDPAAPRGIMDLLFAELMLWGRNQAIAGSASEWRRCPVWSVTRSRRSGTRSALPIFDLGEEFYNFEGLYQYKAKFDPDWRPRYLASPPGLSVPIILLTITRLIAGTANQECASMNTDAFRNGKP
jgi:phosphatidylglycerol lysyltransferase